MTLELGFFNIWAVVVGFVINMVVGALWYSPVLFGNVWLKLVGKTADEISKEDATKSMLWSFIPAFLSVLFLALILGLTKSQTIIDGLLVGLILTIGVIGMYAWNHILYEGRSTKLTILNVGYSVVALNLAAIILVLWK